MAVTYLFILYCFEAGFFFVFIPWTRFWALNPLLHYTPFVGLVADNNFVRGFITGFGLAHLIIGVVDLYFAVIRRKPSF